MIDSLVVEASAAVALIAKEERGNEVGGALRAWRAGGRTVIVPPLFWQRPRGAGPFRSVTAHRLAEVASTYEREVTWPDYRGTSAYLAKLRAETLREGGVQR